MRYLLLAVVAGLAVLAVSIRAEEAHEAESVPETLEVDFDLDDDTVARMLGDLFDDEDFEEALEKQQNNREARARGRDEEESVVEEKAVQVDPKDQARYNSFIDTFFRRLNSYARSRFDPLSIGLVKKEGKKAGAKGGKDKGGKGKKKDKKKGKGKKDGKDGKDTKDANKDKKEKGGKKKGRHPKDLDLEEVAEETEVQETEAQVEEVSAVETEPSVHNITKREVEFDVVEIVEEEEEEDELDLEEDDDDDEESLSRVTRDVEEVEDPSDVDETNRRGKPAKGGSKQGKAKKGGKKGGKAKKGKGKGKGKKGKKDKKGGKKKGGKKGGKKSKRSAKSSKDTRTSRASVSGIATLRRNGDVLVKSKKGGKEMRAQFSLGPVNLKVSRKYSGGKGSVTKDAKAVSPELTGKLSIHVDQNGKARMTNFRINRPAIVQVEGSLRKNGEKGGKSDNNFMEKSISRFSPVASKKLKTASREILSAGEPKAQAN